MKYLLRQDGIEFECSKRPVPKTAQNGVQKIDKITGWPVWAVEVTGFTNEEEGSSVISVNVPSPSMPVLQWREPVELVDLELIPWTQKNGDEFRSGVAFRAKEIRPAGATHLSSVPAA